MHCSVCGSINDRSFVVLGKRAVHIHHFLEDLTTKVHEIISDLFDIDRFALLLPLYEGLEKVVKKFKVVMDGYFEESSLAMFVRPLEAIRAEIEEGKNWDVRNKFQEEIWHRYRVEEILNFADLAIAC